MITTVWPYIEQDERSVPHIKGTRIKVTEIAAEHRAYHWDADQIQQQHPQLTLPQIHAVLGYYHEHQAECDRQIEAGIRQADEICREHENPAVTAKLKSHAGS